MVGWAWSQNEWLQNPRGLWGECRVRVQKIPGLLIPYWWIQPGSGISVGLLAHRAGSWSLPTWPRDPRAGVRSLVGNGWFLTQCVWCMGCSKACVYVPISRDRTQLVSGQSMACSRQAGSIGCEIIAFLYLVGGDGSWPLVGRTMPRGTSRGGCGLRRSSGSPSAEKWACILNQFIVLPEMFQHRCLQTVGLSQALQLMS